MAAVLLLSSLAYASVVAGAQGAGEPGTEPNILIIVTDDQRASGTLRVMPRTRRYLGRGGTRYTRAFAATPLCCPSRATLLTGRYAHNTGVLTNAHGGRIDTTKMFVRVLQEAGYETALVGKFLTSWPLAVSPPFFDRSAAGGGGDYTDPTFNVDGSVRTVRGYSTSLIRDFALRYLRGFERADDAPWFLYVAPVAPHHPWRPAPRYAAARVARWNGNPSLFERDRSDKPPFVRALHHTIDGARRVRAGQLRTLMSVDDMVGDLFATLGRLGEKRRTLVLYTSDNGFLWADHHIGGAHGTAGHKRLPYTASVRVPFLVRWPGHVARGATSDRLTGIVDVAPTVLDAADLASDRALARMDGRSLLRPNVRARILLEYFGRTPFPPWASMRTRTYQYTEYYAADRVTTIFREYYDLSRDPWQLRNLLRDGDRANNPDLRAIAAQLQRDRACIGTRSETACP